jgi:GR25 family glycosyltransferase involved in LPS biosynthesis
MSENIDRIIYINLDKRTDRLEQIQSELKRFNLENKAERFPAIYHPSGTVGFGKSHLSVLKLAKERKYKNVLILEDDFHFVVSKDEFETYLQLLFTNLKEYDVCMFSYNANKSEPSKYPFLLRLLDGQTASGYLVNEKYYDTLINLYEKAIPLLETTGQHWIYANDQIWKKLQAVDTWYCFTNRLGKQRHGFSDNSQTYMEYDC